MIDRHSLFFLGLWFPLVACVPGAADEPPPPLGDHDYRVELPAHFSEHGNGGGAMPPGFDALTDLDNQPEDNRVTNEGAALGRVLFYDVDLSSNRTIACASCHLQERGFSDPEVLSEGFDGGRTGRHSMGLANARFYEPGSFFWDQRAETLEEQVLMPFQDPVEMGMTLDEVIARVQEDTNYEALFEAAFGDADVDSDRISRALAQFVRSMVSVNSPYDEGRAQVDFIAEDFPNFTDEENEGKFLFYAPPPQGGLGCAHCHISDGQVAIGPRSNGLDAETTDPGLGEVTGDPNHDGLFKAPSLRNVADRAPYMHDGRFADLDGVLEHYSSEVNFHPNLPGFWHNGQTVFQLSFTADETAALKAFLETLSDPELLTHERWSDPGW